MTDTVKVSLDLQQLSLDARRCVPVPLRRTTDAASGEILGSTHIAPTIVQSPLSPAKIKFIVRAETVAPPAGNGDPFLLASGIDADLNIPSALVGQNIEHGTSVFAAGTAALWLLKHWLAASGMPRHYLDQIRLEHLRLRSATITFLLQMMMAAAAAEVVGWIAETAKILRPRDAMVLDSSNITAYLPTEYGKLVAYWKTNFAHCHLLNDSVASEQRAVAEILVRLEAVLNAAYLRKRGWDRFEAWRNAYLEDRYRKIFEETVRDALRVNLRHNTPRAEVRQRLTPNELEFLDFYLAGGVPSAFTPVAEASYAAQALSKLRRALLAKTDIDCDIPWCDHVRLRGHSLREVLIYPGDYFPPHVRADRSFCRDSWGGLLEKLLAATHDRVWPELPVWSQDQLPASS